MHLKCEIVYALMVIVAMSVASPSSYSSHCGKECDLSMCMRVRCAPIRQNQCNGTVRQGGGYCRCCQNCIIPLHEGSRCNPNPGYGLLEPVPYCDEGLTCDCRTKRCVRCGDGECEYPFQ